MVDKREQRFLTPLEQFPDDDVTIIVLSNRAYVPLGSIRAALAEPLFDQK